MNKITEERLIGERALFMAHDVEINNCIFADGESPLKESKGIKVSRSSFQWKYPLWYSRDISVKNSTFFEMARAGIWYTNNITLEDILYEAPKGFRRCQGIKLFKVNFINADETLWSCADIEMQDVTAKGNYFAMNSKNMKIDDFNLAGNYSFDGCENIEMRNAKMISRDAFWNCSNVVVRDSYICGEYIGWNSQNITFENCTIESNQGFCYMKNVTLKNCRLLNTDLAFEYVSQVDAEITTKIVSIKNPISGRIQAAGVEELIFDDPAIDKNATEIVLTEK
ncbi:MAG: DUF3737 family protein [Anaerovibrio sp.]|uniref:DUF3737 family protein n=1 Tax=Anaerovibrio sp. TaxID=1872532 RepID=UPI0025EC5761|nr:DUF3737 family protein [Anaerovibrio sp.]MCR5175961.1 DUF3737 family protein [Anaerovibrio sp.]